MSARSPRSRNSPLAVTLLSLSEMILKFIRRFSFENS
nr:MAG TPA: hypothetical protein [Caudoviricetes sp.]